MEKRFSIKSLLLGILMATAVLLSMSSSHAEQPSHVAEWHQTATPASNQHDEKPAEGKILKKKKTFLGKILNFIVTDLFSGDYPDGYTSFTSG